MNGMWKGENLEHNNQCFENSAYIKLWGILSSQERMLKIEIDGDLSKNLL